MVLTHRDGSTCINFQWNVIVLFWGVYGLAPQQISLCEEMSNHMIHQNVQTSHGMHQGSQMHNSPNPSNFAINVMWIFLGSWNHSDKELITNLQLV